MELQAYFLPLRKWWWLLLLATLVAAASSFIAVRQEAERYSTRTTLMIGQPIADPNPSNAQFGLGQQLAQSYADIAEREPVQNAVKESLGLEWLPSYEASALPNRQLVEIVVVDTDPVRARDVANELATQLVNLSPSGTNSNEQERQAFIQQQLDKLQLQIEETEEEITAKQAELGELFSARDIEQTEQDLSALEQKLRTLQSTYASLLSNASSNAINTLTIIEPAAVPDQPIGPNRIVTVATAAAIALALAAGAAYLLEYVDDTVQSPEEITAHFGLNTLAHIGEIDAETPGSDIITVDSPRSPHAEAFRGLRATIQYSSANNSARCLLITSTHPGDGKSLIASNLGAAMAQAGHRVLIVDSDLHRPILHKIFGVDNEAGLSDVLLQRRLAPQTNIKDVAWKYVKQTEEEGLYVLTSGPEIPNTSELLSTTSFRELLDVLLVDYDFVLLDSPPVMAVTDPVVLSTQADSTLLVVQAGKTRRPELKKTIERLNGVGANLGGIVLNRVALDKANYYGGYDYYTRLDDTQRKGLATVELNGQNSLLHSLRKKLFN